MTYYQVQTQDNIPIMKVPTPLKRVPTDALIMNDELDLPFCTSSVEI